MALTRTLPALKEWAFVCERLLAGRQAVMLRKGGIDEKGFWVEAEEFLLYPTYFHQMVDKVRPEFAGECAQVLASPWRGAACEPTGDHPSLSEEGNRLAFRTGPGTAWLWERGSGTPDRILDCGYPLSVDLSGDGRSLLIASGCALVAGAATHDESMEAYVRDLATGKVDEVSIADAPA